MQVKGTGKGEVWPKVFKWQKKVHIREIRNQEKLRYFNVCTLWMSP